MQIKYFLYSIWSVMLRNDMNFFLFLLTPLVLVNCIDFQLFQILSKFGVQLLVHVIVSCKRLFEWPDPQIARLCELSIQLMSVFYPHSTIEKRTLIVYVFFVNLWKLEICSQPSFLHDLCIFWIIYFDLCKIDQILIVLRTLYLQLDTIIRWRSNEMNFAISRWHWT
jgi:hypothetical protein